MVICDAVALQSTICRCCHGIELLFFLRLTVSSIIEKGKELKFQTMRHVTHIKPEWAVQAAYCGKLLIRTLDLA